MPREITADDVWKDCDALFPEGQADHRAGSA